jgi:hypothetical protein
MNMDVIVFMDMNYTTWNFWWWDKIFEFVRGYSIHVSKIYHKKLYQFGWNILLGSHLCSPIHQISIKPNFSTSWKVRIHMTYINFYFQHSLIFLSSIIFHQPLIYSISECWSLQNLGLFFSRSKKWKKLVNV